MGTLAEAPDLGGRPSIYDHFQLYLYVTAGAREKKMSVRRFTELRTTWFDGTLRIGDAGPTRERIRGEALRRRYNKTRVALGLVQYRKDVIEQESPNHAVDLIKETLEFMVNGLSQ